jgi:hypothetical protein
VVLKTAGILAIRRGPKNLSSSCNSRTDSSKYAANNPLVWASVSAVLWDVRRNRSEVFRVNDKSGELQALQIAALTSHHERMFDAT